MDAENLLAKVTTILSVRRAFGTAYEKDGTADHPGRDSGGRRRRRYRTDPAR